MTEALRPTRPLLDRWRRTEPGSTDVVPSRPGQAGAGATDARSAARAEARRPYHVATLVGASAGIYAVTLAAVTGLQSATDRATTELQAPVAAAADQLAAEHDILDRRLAAIRADLEDGGSSYDALAAAMSTYSDGLTGLASAVGALEGQAASLPTRVSLPSAPRVGAATKPRTVTTTGASGKP